MILLNTSLCWGIFYKYAWFTWFWFICLSGWLSFQIFHLSLEFSFCFLGSQPSGVGGAICSIHLLIETIDLLIHTNGPPASSLWLPVDVSHPKKKPPSAAALVMAPDFASLAVLWWLPSINCSGLVQYLHSVYRSFVWQWQIFIGLPGRRILAIHWGWACLDSLLLCFEPHTLTHQCSGGM